MTIKTNENLNSLGLPGVPTPKSACDISGYSHIQAGRSLSHGYLLLALLKTLRS